MKYIMHCANFYGPKSGGLRTTVDSLANQYMKSGNLVTIVVPSHRNLCTKMPYGFKYEIASPKIPGKSGYRVIWRIDKVAKILRSFQPNILELSDRTTLLLLSRLNRKLGGETYLFAHERIDGVLTSFLGQSKFWIKIANFWNKLTMKLVDGVVTTTDYAKVEFDRIAQPTYFSPLGVDLELFHPSMRKLPFDSYIPSDKFLIGMCTRLSREKDPLFILDIVAETLRRKLDIHCVVAGDGPLLQELQERSIGLPITYLGFLNERVEVATFLASIDVCISPGPIETFGLAALEAIACGTPVIANNQSAIGEVIGEAGIVLERNSSLWVDAIEILQKRDRRNLALQVRQRAESFNWKNTADRLLSIYQKDNREIA